MRASAWFLGGLIVGAVLCADWASRKIARGAA